MGLYFGRFGKVIKSIRGDIKINYSKLEEIADNISRFENIMRELSYETLRLKETAKASRGGFAKETNDFHTVYKREFLGFSLEELVSLKK